MICCDIQVKVSFTNHTIVKKDSGVVEGDYNTTKFVFEFDEDVSGHRIVFKMSNPNGELILIKDLVDNEVTLAGYDDDGNVYSLFNMAGPHPFELVLYGEKSKLTSATGWLSVNKRQVNIGEGGGGEYYLPVFEEVYTRVMNLDNLNIQATKVGNATTLTVTNIHGESHSVVIYDGEDGEDLTGHVHDNIDALKKFTEDESGNLLYNGEPITSESEINPELLEEISLNTEWRHRHPNSDIINRFQAYIDGQHLSYGANHLIAWLSEIPTKLSSLENDSGFITAEDLPEGTGASSTSVAIKSKTYQNDWTEGIVTTGSNNQSLDFLVYEVPENSLPIDISIKINDKTYFVFDLINEGKISRQSCLHIQAHYSIDTAYGMPLVAKIASSTGQAITDLSSEISEFTLYYLSTTDSEEINHSNIETLDKLSEDEQGNLLFNGKQVGSIPEDFPNEELSLGVHTDGLLYLFFKGKPVGNGIEMSVGGDIVGYVDSENNIVVKGNLGDGAYSVKYEMEDGSKIDIGELVLSNETDKPITNRLPVEYQEVEWVQINNSGTYHCGIKTDLLWSGVNKIITKVQNIHSGETKDIIFSTWDSETSKTSPYIRTYNGGNLFANASGLAEYAVTPEIDNADTNANEFTMVWASSTGATIFFGSYQDDSYSNPHKWYFVEFYNGDTLVGQFVPCYRISDSAIGFYDIVSGTFYTNTSTDTGFIKGTNV